MGSHELLQHFLPHFFLSPRVPVTTTYDDADDDD